MRKIFLLLIIFLTMICFGCGGSSKFVVKEKFAAVYEAPGVSGYTVDKIYKGELIEPISIEEVNGEKWYEVTKDRWINSKECTDDNELVKQAEGRKKELDKLVGEKCSFVADYDSYRSAGTYLGDVPNEETAKKFYVDSLYELFVVQGWKNVNGRVWLYGNVISTYTDTKSGWILKEKCSFDKKHIEYVQTCIDVEKEEIAKAEREWQERIKKNPLTETSWTEKDGIFTYVCVQVENHSNKSESAYVSVRFYRNNILLGSLGDVATLDPHGKWLARFIADPYLHGRGKVEYKVELKRSILE